MEIKKELFGNKPQIITKLSTMALQPW